MHENQTLFLTEIAECKIAKMTHCFNEQFQEADPELETKWPVRNRQNTATRNIDHQKKVTKVATNPPKKTNIEIIVMERGKEKRAEMEIENITVNHLKNPDVELMIRRI